MTYRLEAATEVGPAGGDYWAGPQVIVHGADDSVVAMAELRVTGTVRRSLGDDSAALLSAAWPLLVSRVESLLATSGLDDFPAYPGILPIVIDSYDTAAVRELQESRARAARPCEWRTQEGRDLYCLASGPNDVSSTMQIKGRTAAPTSFPICADCDMPDSRVVCSSLSHPDVRGAALINDRQVVAILCQRGRTEAQAPGGCRPDAHPCWERVVNRMHGEVERVPADALPEALDHLNAVFRLRVGTNRQLLRLRSASKAAGLTFDCRDAIGFKARLNDLYDVLDQLRIDADLLPGYDSSDPRFRGTLNRVQRWCEAELEDPAEAIDAIGVLRNVIALRAALTHSEREAEVPTRLTQLGLPFPVADWTLAWESIRAQVTRALRRLRLAIESDEPGDK